MIDIRNIKQKIRFNNYSMGDQVLKNIWFSNKKENNLESYKQNGVIKL
jgi:hypothetical protein